MTRHWHKLLSVTVLSLLNVLPLHAQIDEAARCQTITADTIEALQRRTTLTMDDWMYRLVFSTDSRYLAAPSVNGDVYLWDRQVSAAPQPLAGHVEAVTDAVFAPQGTTLYSASIDGTIRVWDASTGANDILIDHDQDRFWSLDISADEAYLAAGTSGKVLLFDIARGELMAEHVSPNEAPVLDLTFSPDGEHIAFVHASGALLWDWETDAEVVALADPATRVEFTSDGAYLAIDSDENGALAIWDRAAEQLNMLEQPQPIYAAAIALTWDDMLLLTATSDRTIQAYRVSDGTLATTIPLNYNETVYALGLSPDGTALVVGYEDGTVELWGAKCG